MPIVPIRTICREEKQSFLTLLGISVTRSHLGQLQVHFSDPLEHTVSTSEPVAPLSEGNGNDEGYIFSPLTALLILFLVAIALPGFAPFVLIVSILRRVVRELM